MNIRGTIWATTQERAERMLRDMEHRYAFCGYKTITRMRNQCSFDNGDIWRARIASLEKTQGVR